jgi:hypothetical protein
MKGADQKAFFGSAFFYCKSRKPSHAERLNGHNEVPFAAQPGILSADTPSNPSMLPY